MMEAAGLPSLDESRHTLELSQHDRNLDDFHYKVALNDTEPSKMRTCNPQPLSVV